MKCEQAIPLLDAYLDGELELTACTEMEAHLENCVECRKRLEKTRELVTLLQEEAPRFEASAFLETRVRARLREAEGKRSLSLVEKIREIALWVKRRQSGVARALTALALLGVALVMAGGSGGDRVSEEAIANHVRSLQAAHLMDVVSTDRHTVKPWFAGKLDFSPPVVDLHQDGYTLVGGRLDFLNHRDVAALVYQRRKHFINLFIWPAREGEARKDTFQADGYRVQGWTAGGMNYLAVSELGVAEMREFAEKLKAGGGSVRE